MNIEEARRAVLEVPHDFPFSADDYLDQLAEELLEDRRRDVQKMADAAPTPLARALIFNGKTRAGLAEAIGVSGAAVGHWASGEKPLPAGRLVEISRILGVKPSELRDAPRPAPDGDDLSYFGWIVEHVVMQGYYGPQLGDVALTLGVTLGRLKAYRSGAQEVPEAIVHALAEAYLPNLARKLSPSLTSGTRPT